MTVIIGFITLVAIVFLWGYHFGEKAERAKWMRDKDDTKFSDDKR